MAKHRSRECKNKCRHPTKEGACIEARKVVNVGMNVYKCKDCGFWHIGKTRDRTRSAERIGALLAQHEKKLERRNKNKISV